MTSQDLLSARSLVIDILAQELNATKNVSDMLVSKVAQLDSQLNNEQIVKKNLEIRLDDARREIDALKRERDGALR
jgi:hypothetical protein